MTTQDIIEPGTDIAVTAENIQTFNAIDIYRSSNSIHAVIERIKAAARAEKHDISTVAGRAALASHAHKIARIKVALDKMGKDLTEEYRVKVSAINADRNLVETELSALKDEIRRPLTEWENAEKNRVKAHEDAVAAILLYSTMPLHDASSADILARLAEVPSLESRNWQEFAQRASDAHAQTVAHLTRLAAAAKTREDERAELERLRAEEEKRRAEQAERDRIEREERIAREAAEAARIAAEQKAAAEAKAQADREAAERRRIEEEAAQKAREQAQKEEAERERIRESARLEAERAEAERRRIEEEKAAEKARADKAERDAREAAEKAEKARLAAERKAEDDRIAAIEAERKRVAEEAKKAEAERIAREKNKAHRARINNAALAGLVALGLTEDQGKSVISAIAKGEIAHVSIAY